MSTTPFTDFGFSNPPLPETPAQKLAELVRLQKFAQRITSTLDIEELVPRIVDEVAASLGRSPGRRLRTVNSAACGPSARIDCVEPVANVFVGSPSGDPTGVASATPTSRFERLPY